VSELHGLIDASILVNHEGAPANRFATIQMTSANQCPLLSEDRLCRIHAEHGEAFLPHTCAVYPRVVNAVGDIEEEALTLSCPEAARLVLLHSDLLNSGETGPFLLESEPAQAVSDAGSVHAWFWPLREFVLELVRNRDYPLWQRLFLLGIFSKLFDARVEVEESIAELLRNFVVEVASGSLRAKMDALPSDPGRQLDAVLRFAGILNEKCNPRPRFLACVQAFTAGIGNGPGATFESLTAGYLLAHDRFYLPLLERHPKILENYLINTIFRSRFPLGREAMPPGVSPSMTREFTLLAAQFALMKGLLIGVAGFHGNAFSLDHVLHTMQSAARHFEHHLEFLDQIYAVARESGMECEEGMAILLGEGQDNFRDVLVPAAS
jgi:lysine-N-methylase